MILLQTPRLNIRRFTDSEEDVKFIAALLNTEGWLAFIGDRGIRTFADARQYVEERFTSKYGSTDFIMYAIDVKETGETIGMCGLVKRDYLDHPDVGYALLPAFEGKGYASEAAAAMVRYAKETLGHKKVMAIVTPSNVRSIALLENLGFAFVEIRDEKGEMLRVFESGA